jgi:4-hydroxybenzoate polyprenyltransferase
VPRVRHMLQKRFPKAAFNGILTMMTTIDDTTPRTAGSATEQVFALVRAMRPLHWMKNGLVFVPILLAHEIFAIGNFLHGAIAFLALSLCASAIYLLNDLVDIESDKNHPKKRERPLASGILSKSTAYIAAPMMILAAFALALPLPNPTLFAGTLAAYLAVALIYVFYFKRKLLLDVLCLAGLHTLRIVAGSIAADIPQSSWLLAFSVFLFFSLALVKRYSELRISEDDRGLRARGRGYQKGDLDILSQMGIASGSISALIMALYVDSAAVKEQYATPELIWLICPIVLYVVARIWVLAHRGEVSDDPVVFIMKDWRSHLMGLVIVAIMIAAS